MHIDEEALLMQCHHLCAFSALHSTQPRSGAACHQQNSRRS